MYDDLRRPRWSSRMDYILTCFGFCIGLPTVWRFPYICYENGGGSFLFAYLILSLCVGIPMYQLELSMGQAYQRGFVQIWGSFNRRMAAFGLSTLILAFICGSYFTVILAYTLYYMAESLIQPHPWSIGGISPTDSALKHFLENVLHKSRSVSDWDLGQTNPLLILSLIISCAITFVASWGKLTGNGPIAAFSAIFPLIGLVILTMQFVTLPGSSIGLSMFLIPNPGELLSLKLWTTALVQVFFSCGIGWGSLVNFGSYSDPTNDVRISSDQSFSVHQRCLDRYRIQHFDLIPGWTICFRPFGSRWFNYGSWNHHNASGGWQRTDICYLSRTTRETFEPPSFDFDIFHSSTVFRSFFGIDDGFVDKIHVGRCQSRISDLYLYNIYRLIFMCFASDSAEWGILGGYFGQINGRGCPFSHSTR